MVRPHVSTNLAISADGKISPTPQRATGWTSPEDHARLIQLRCHAGALLVGRGTLVADRMTLTAPGNPRRCIVSRNGDFDPSHPVFSTPGGPIHLVVTAKKEILLPDEILAKTTLHLLSLQNFLSLLATDYQITHVHCEGGGTLISALAEMDAIDEFHLTLAGHTLFGGHLASTVTGIPGEFLPRSLDFEIRQFEPRPDLGECFLSYSRRT